MSDSTGSSSSGASSIRAAVERIVEDVQVSQRRRVAVIAGVSFMFWLVVELGANLAYLLLIVVTALFAFLYVQKTAQETLVASAYGPGALVVGVGLFLVYQSAAGGSTEPLADTLLRVSGWPLAGFVLVVLGILAPQSRHVNGACLSSSECHSTTEDDRARPLADLTDSSISGPAGRGGATLEPAA